MLLSTTEVKGYAAIAQLVERDLAKVEVAGPSPVCRSSSNEKCNHEFILKIF